MKSGIYEILNTENGKRYIGQSMDLDSRKAGHLSRIKGKCHGNRHLRFASESTHHSVFVFKVLEEVSQSMLNDREIFWISKFNSTDDKYGYNFQSGGTENNFISDETRILLSEKGKGRIVGLKTRIAISKSLKGVKHSLAAIEKTRLANKGIKRTEEFKKKLAAMNVGRIAPESFRNLMSKIHKGNKYNAGRKASAETRAKMSASQKLRKVSPSTKLKISAALKGRKITWINKTIESSRKLKPDQVADIRARLLNKETQGSIAIIYNVDKSTISHINTGAGYSEIKCNNN
jgi:group I intron endonuclease